jgi:hypothetical protein
LDAFWRLSKYQNLRTANSKDFLELSAINTRLKTATKPTDVSWSPSCGLLEVLLLISGTLLGRAWPMLTAENPQQLLAIVALPQV